MYCYARLRRTGLIIISVIIILGFSQHAFSQGSYLLEIKVDDVIACQGQTNVAIPIYMKNYANTVAGFSLLLRLDRPDIMEFQASMKTIEYDVHYIYTEWDDNEPPIPTDSVLVIPTWVCLELDFPNCLDSALILGYYKCTDYSGPDCTDSVFMEWTEGIDPVYTNSYVAMVRNFETVGTLTSGWEYITARSPSENGLDILITAFADRLLPYGFTPGIGYPQEGEIPLIKILADVYPLDESAIDRTVAIGVEYNFVDNFGFSNELGQSQCVRIEEIEQFTYFMCDQWLVPDEICMYWNRVQEFECPSEGCDSIKVDTLLYGYLDVDQCCDPVTGECIPNIPEAECGEKFGGTGVWYEGCISITDGSLYAKQCLCGDLDDDGIYNILDVVYLINYKYKEGPPPAPLAAGDANGDGIIDIMDAICLINTLYKDSNCANCNWLE